MRVGVYLSNLEQELGGAHTFEREIFEALQKHAAETSHEFVYVSRLRESPPEFRQRGLVHVSIDLPSSSSARPWNRVLRKLNRLAGGQLLPSTSPLPRHHDDPIAQVLHQNEIDVLWSLGPQLPTFQIPFLLSVWDLAHRLLPYFPEVQCGTWPWQAREMYYQTALPRATAILTGTEVGRADIVNLYQVPAERIFVTPHPTPAFALHPAEVDVDAILRKYSLERGYLFYPAQFWGHKNHVGLLRAVAHLKTAHGRQFRLVFVGSDQGNGPYLRQTVQELGLSDQVTFLGFVSREELVALYRGAAALTFLSYFGPDNLPPLEAFALDCPVLASHVPGSDEQLGAAACLVNPDSTSEIAAGILRIVDDLPYRTQLIASGRERAGKFTGSDFVRRVFSILDDFAPRRACWR